MSAAKDEVERAQASARREIAEREAQTEALIAAARDEMMRQLVVPVYMCIYT